MLYIFGGDIMLSPVFTPFINEFSDFCHGSWFAGEGTES